MALHDTVHIGLPKTGTTTLQRDLFPHLVDRFYMGRHHEDLRIRTILQRINCEDTLQYDSAEVAGLFQEVVQTHGLEDIPIIVSKERLSTETNADRRLIAERLRETFREPHVVITLRGQFSMIKSMYMQAARGWGDGNRPLSFEEWLESEWARLQSNRVGAFVRMQFLPLIELHEEVMGPDRVHVLLFEDFKHEPEAFARDLLDTLEAEAPEATIERFGSKRHQGRATDREMAMKSLFGRFPAMTRAKSIVPGALKRPLRAFVRRGNRPDLDLPPAWKAQIEELTAADNRRLEKKLNRSLADLGYPT